MDWGRVPADTMVVESKNITLRDVVNAAANGVDTAGELMEHLGLEEGEAGTSGHRTPPERKLRRRVSRLLRQLLAADQRQKSPEASCMGIFRVFFHSLQWKERGDDGTQGKAG